MRVLYCVPRRRALQIRAWWEPIGTLGFPSGFGLLVGFSFQIRQANDGDGGLFQEGKNVVEGRGCGGEGWSSAPAPWAPPFCTVNAECRTERGLELSVLNRQQGRGWVFLPAPSKWIFQS
jgi:hypothetical protein